MGAILLDLDPEDAQVKAAGCVAWRARAGAAPELAVVHRPRWDDWSLPKGKLDPGESWEQAALRELEEETGLSGALGEPLAPVAYRDHRGRTKAVRYWLLEVVDAVAFAPNDEVDELRWLDPAAAEALVSYPGDAATIARAAPRLPAQTG